MKLRLLPILLFLCCFYSGIGQKKVASPVLLTDELKKFYDLSSLPAYLDNSFVAQVSTYDRTGGNEDGFTGKYSYLKRNADSSLVIFDMKGPGVITRIWTPTPTEDSFDFYFDGHVLPDFTIRYNDLFSGLVFPFVHPLCGNQLGGFYCYFPILFNKSCRIVCRGKKLQFHQIQYKLYPPGTAVKPFTTELNNEEKTALQKIESAWNTHPYIGNATGLPLTEIRTVQNEVVLLSGENKTVFTTDSGGRILGMELDPASVFEGDFKSTDIKITWDDEKIPAVYCPVADFFGFAFGKPSMQSFLLGSSHSRLYCFFPMPFDRKATVQLIRRKSYGQSEALKIHCTFYLNDKKRDPNTEGRFYASWNRVVQPGEPHVFLSRKGKGHYVGTILQAQGLKAGMTYFFEGDDSTSVDGSMRIHGTGSEDYFNGGWYALADRWDNKMSLPIHGCLEYSLPFCRTGGYRFYLTDKIPFEKSIYQCIEHGPSGNREMVDYTSLGIYYADAAPETYLLPTDALTRVELPDTLMMYPQLMYFSLQGTIAASSAWKYNTGGLSYTFTTTNESALKISLSEIPFGRYRLLMDYVNDEHGSSFSVWQGQIQLTQWISTYDKKEKQMNAFYLADFENNAFKNAITLQFKTIADRNKFIFNRLIFVRKTE